MGQVAKGNRGLNEAYALIREAMDILAQIPDIELAEAKRAMYELEDLLWQAVTEDQGR